MNEREVLGLMSGVLFWDECFECGEKLAVFLSKEDYERYLEFGGEFICSPCAEGEKCGKRIWKFELEDVVLPEYCIRAIYSRPEPYEGVVYFIQSEYGGPIKIGHSFDVKKRLGSLQTGHPDKLILLGSFYGSQYDEHELHEKFAPYRIRGEWFQPTEPILEKIKTITK
jgi:hypothetical protein